MIKSKLWDMVVSFFQSRKTKNAIHEHPSSTYTKTLFAPSYDTASIITSKWAQSWAIGNVVLHIGSKAAHAEAVSVVRKRTPFGAHRLLFFVGHGHYGALLTAPKLGKLSTVVKDSRHGCMLDRDDLPLETEGIHCVAWSCYSGRDFGARYNMLKSCKFLGFNDFISMMVQRRESESLWSGTIENLFKRVSSRGSLTTDDPTWLRNKLLELRAAIKDGRIDTGPHNRLNTMFLKANAKRVCFHERKEI
jgi:hypothetical protein